MGICVSKATNVITRKKFDESLGFPDSDHEYDPDHLQKTLNEAGHKYVVIKFFDSCATCAVMAKPFEELSQELPNVIFLEASIDQNHASAKELNIKMLPTFVVFKNHQEISRHVGVKPDVLRSFVNEALSE